MDQPDHTSRGLSGVSRREFLKGSGAAAAVTALATAPAVAEAAQKDPKSKTKVFGSGPTKVILTINGTSYELKLQPRTTLLEVLRNQIGLTGAKPVDTDGSSGASTVLVDNKPVNASTTFALACLNRSIQTAEGLLPKKPQDPPDPVLLAFIASDASQCGFCTPGFVMAVKSFLQSNPRATEEQVRKGLGGNLCRCGTYANIIQAIGSLSKGGARA